MERDGGGLGSTILPWKIQFREQSTAIRFDSAGYLLACAQIESFKDRVLSRIGKYVFTLKIVIC